jgi:hypothetical protein
MISALSLIAVFTIVVFLGGAMFGMLVLFVISIHRTRHAPLSDVHSERGGAVSRRVLTATRAGRKGDSE